MTTKPAAWGITTQYLMFFLLTSLLPMVVISALFLKSGNDKLNDRIQNEVNLGILLTESLYQSDLNELALATEQAAQFHVGSEYNRMEAANNIQPLRGVLDHYREIQDLDILTVFDTPTVVRARSGFISYKLADSYNGIIQSAFEGKTVSTVEAFQDDTTGRIFLAHLAAAPIPNARGQITGVLVAGRSVSHEYSLQQLLKTLPDLDARILMKVDDHAYEVLSASSASFKGVIPPEKKLIQSAASYLQKDDPGTFSEKINGKPYLTKASPIMDFRGDVVGYIIVSTSEEDFTALRNSNLTFILLYLFIGFGVVGFTGLWFQKVFVQPVDTLSVAFTQVSEGNLDVRVSEDIPQHEMQRMLAGFNAMLKKLKETEHLRDTFISSLTHDLRTPVTAQKRVLETLVDMNNEMDPEVGRITSGLLKNNEQLLDMINKLLEASQYEAGSIKIHPESTSLYKLVANCCNELKPIADPKHIIFINRIPENFPVIMADPAQLRRVFINLFGNALDNIGHHKEITISARDDGPTVAITVTDNGPGLPEELMQGLFERYFTGHKTRQKIGSGLGLFICRMIVEYHGGRIAAQSKRGEGASFTITLPKQPASKIVPIKAKKNRGHHV